MGALARALSGDGGGATGEAKQRPQPYFVSGCASRCQQVCQAYEV
jgi:hypothetical protein